MSDNKLIITREAIESGEYTADPGIIILIAPEGVPTVRHITNVASDILTRKKLPQGVIRYPNDGLTNVITDTRLDNQNK